MALTSVKIQSEPVLLFSKSGWRWITLPWRRILTTAGRHHFFDHEGPAHLDSITFRYLPEDETRIISLENQETNFISRVPVIDVERLETDGGFQILNAETPMMPESILINVQKYPLDNKMVRQAMLYAVDRNAIVDTLFFGIYPAAFGPLSPANPGYWDGVEDMYPFDPEKGQGATQRGWLGTGR